MSKNKILKIIAGLLTGCGIGLCIGVASSNVLVGLLVGASIGLCFAVSFSSFNKN